MSAVFLIATPRHGVVSSHAPSGRADEWAPVPRTLSETPDELGWSDTFDAEYVALTQLQADALITLDGQLAHAVKDLVTVAPIQALS
jgi:hypothetical protein